MSWFKFLNLSGIVRCVTKSLNRSQCLCLCLCSHYSYCSKRQKTVVIVVIVVIVVSVVVVVIVVIVVIVFIVVLWSEVCYSVTRSPIELSWTAKKTVGALINGFHEQSFSHPAAQDDKSQGGSSKDLKSWVLDCIKIQASAQKASKEQNYLISYCEMTLMLKAANRKDRKNSSQKISVK